MSSQVDGKAEFCALIEQLIKAPQIPFGDSRLSESNEHFTGDPVFDGYCRKAVELVRSSQINWNDIILCFQKYRRILQDRLDSMEYITDLLRIVSKEFKDLTLQKFATEKHLKILAQMSFGLRRQSTNNNDKMMHRARNAARKGLKIIDSITEYSISPDIHADMLLAMGQTYARPDRPTNIELSEALDYYSKALDLKKQAENFIDVQRLQKLIEKMILFLLPTISASAKGIGGLGSTLRNLEAAYKTVYKLNNKLLAFDVTLELCNLYSTIRQPKQAEELLRDLLSSSIPSLQKDYDDMLVRKKRDDARFALASSLSEQGRAIEAAEIQEALINEGCHLLSKPENASVLWMNFGNSRREIGDLSGSLNAFETGLNLASKVENLSERQNIQIQIHTLLGEILFLLGQPNKGKNELEKVKSSMVSPLPGIEQLHFHSIAARCYYGIKDYDLALSHLNNARDLLQKYLERGPNPFVWESMLASWNDLDGRVIEINLAKGNDDATKDALVVAEASKGRILMEFSRSSFSTQESQTVLSGMHHKEALKKAQVWAAEKPGRYIVSLFADKNGLAVFVIGEGGSISGMWLKEAEYDSFMTDYYEPWSNLITSSLVQPELLRLSGSMTELLLERVGEWLWRAFPKLADGGDELIIIPHRLFRSLPLSYCKLPGGIRLTERFDHVMIHVSLYDLSLSLDRDQRIYNNMNMIALVDPDGTLPFARLEGFLTAGTNATKTGHEVTAKAIYESFSRPDIVLLSCHGRFNEKDPWRSIILASDDSLEISKLVLDYHKIAAELVILGACESGRFRRSVSDEPIGFPGLLIHGGTRAVVAPMWNVDDFSSLLFLSKFLRQCMNGSHPASAIGYTAAWLRELKVSEVADNITELIRQAQKIASDNNITDDTLAYIMNRLEEMQRWLKTQNKNSRPFRSPQDWAAFQIFGIPPINMIMNKEDKHV